MNTEHGYDESGNVCHSIDSLAAKYGWPVDNNFAAGCYNQNTLVEIRHALENQRSPFEYLDDCRAWEITHEQWVECLCAAWNELASELPELI